MIIATQVIIMRGAPGMEETAVCPRTPFAMTIYSPFATARIPTPVRTIRQTVAAPVSRTAPACNVVMTVAVEAVAPVMQGRVAIVAYVCPGEPVAGMRFG